MKKKNLMLIAGLVLCAVIVAAGISKFAGKKSEAAADQSVAETSVEKTEETAENVSEDAQKEEDKSSEKDKDKKKDNGESTDNSTEEFSRTPGSGNASGNGGYSGGGNGGNGGNGAGSENEIQKEKIQITFPYEVPGSSLVIQNVSSYDGVFLEDGSDTDISGVAAIVMKNTGSEDIEYAKIQLGSESGDCTFEASDIPAGATIVAQEINKVPYSGVTFNSCKSEVGEKKLEQSAGIISVEEQSDGTILVKNLTGSTIPCVRVFYKFYMNEEAAYVGGITYNAKLTDLAANASETIAPTHYAAGYSKVVMVRTYDTAD